MWMGLDRVEVISKPALFLPLVLVVKAGLSEDVTTLELEVER
jgi:hypothetical protein